MKNILQTVCSITALLGACTLAHAEEALIGLNWGDDAELVKTTLEDACTAVTIKNVASPQFPFAQNNEQHFLCSGLTIASKTIQHSVFVVADNALQMIEMRDGATEALINPRKDEALSYIKYSVYEQGKIIADTEADTVWILSKEALQTNLFTWSNPYLDNPDAPPPSYNRSAALPSFINFGEDLEVLRPQFKAACPILKIDNIDPVWLPHEPETQIQVNCFGYEYAGFPRKFEIVFGDGKLELVWILTGKGEEGRVRQALIKEFGAVETVTDDWEVFNNGQIGLRKDKPEVLAISKKLVPFYEKRRSLEK